MRCLNISLKILVLLQIALMTWACSGTRVEFMYPMLAVAVLMFSICAFTLHSQSNLLKKTLEYVLLFAIVVCTIQYFNPYLERVNGEQFIRFVKLPHITWLPKSVKSEFFIGNPLSELAELTIMFASAIGFLEAFKNKRFLLVSLSFFALNATAMGIFGVWQQNNNITDIYGCIYANTGVFVTFFMANAAGAFLNLGLAASLALFTWIIYQRGKIKFLSTIFLLFAFLNSYASYESKSMAAIALMFGTWASVLTLIVVLFLWNKVSKLSSISVCIIFIAIVIASIWNFVPHDPNVYNPQTDVKFEGGKSFSISTRIKLYSMSIDTIKENPIFGTGGDSCQYVLSLRMVNDIKANKNKIVTTVRHAHSDILEYAIDFGLIGVLAILACFGAWIFQYLKNGICYENIPLFVGALISIFHSFIDMNLNIPSSMLAFTLIVCASVSLKRQKGNAQ